MSEKNSFSIRGLFQVQYVLIWVLVAMIILFAICNESFLTPKNLFEILRSSAINAALILGLTWIVAIGEFDVSFGDVAALSNVTLVWLVMTFQMPWWAAAAIAFACGVLVGITNGLLIGYLKFPSLITTIATLAIARSLANIMAKGSPIFLATGVSILSNIVYGKIFGIPVLVIFTMVIYLLCYFIQDKTVLGQHLYAIGENRAASEKAGINVPKIMFSTFVLSSSLAAIGGILLTAQMNSGQPQIGKYFLIDGFAAVFLGAMIIKVGKPNVIGTFAGIIILMVLFNGLTFVGISSYQADVIRGGLLLFGVIMYVVSQSKQKNILLD